MWGAVHILRFNFEFSAVISFSCKSRYNTSSASPSATLLKTPHDVPYRSCHSSPKLVSLSLCCSSRSVELYSLSFHQRALIEACCVCGWPERRCSLVMMVSCGDSWSKWSGCIERLSLSGKCLVVLLPTRTAVLLISGGGGGGGG